MQSSLPIDEPIKVGQLLRRRLQELERTPEELAEAVRVPPQYIKDLIAGRRRPPLPGRTDVYEPMTSFLRLGRNDLATCAQTERAATKPAKGSLPRPNVRRLLLDMCEPDTARELERRRGKNGSAELIGLLQRLLALAQGAVRRVLADQATLRVAAERSGRSYAATRLTVLEFLDTTPDTLTPEDVARFLRPRISLWDVDLETGVLRIVLQGQEQQGTQRRRPNSRTHGL